MDGCLCRGRVDHNGPAQKFNRILIAPDQKVGVKSWPKNTERYMVIRRSASSSSLANSDTSTRSQSLVEKDVKRYAQTGSFSSSTIANTYLKKSPVQPASAGSVTSRTIVWAPCAGLFMNSHIQGKVSTFANSAFMIGEWRRWPVPRTSPGEQQLTVVLHPSAVSFPASALLPSTMASFECANASRPLWAGWRRLSGSSRSAILAAVYPASPCSTVRHASIKQRACRRASSRHTSRPMPPVAPVTTITRPGMVFPFGQGCPPMYVLQMRGVPITNTMPATMNGHQLANGSASASAFLISSIARTFCDAHLTPEPERN
uniref:Uncharacterized protein n=1 Tax=Anopheles coluzzii TaxID=1518534 RepID=A0A8W7PWB9_ANOCL